MSCDAKVDVSVVMPVFNEVGHLHAELERIQGALDKSPYRYELVVIDDGSTDGSTEALELVEGIRLIRFAQNRGSGLSRKVGTQAARGEVVVWTDVDMSYPNDRIPWLVDQLKGFDQVVGARTSEEGTKKALRVPAKWFIRMLAQYLTQTSIPDLNSGFRAFRRPVALQYLKFLPVGFSCVTTITMAFLANGYSVRYVDILYAKRAGSSKFHWSTDTRKYVTQVIRMVLTYNPLRVFLPLGFFLLAVGSAKLVFDFVDKDFRVGTNTIVLLMAAFQVMVMGLLADLVGRLGKPTDEVPPASL